MKSNTHWLIGLIVSGLPLIVATPVHAQMRSGVADYLNLYYLFKAEGRVDCGYIAAALMQLDNPSYRPPTAADRAETISLARKCGLRGVPSR